MVRKKGKLHFYKYIAKLVAYGLLMPGNNEKLKADSVMVRTPTPSKVRLTFDYRVINMATEQMEWQMPHFEH